MMWLTEYVPVIVVTLSASLDTKHMSRSVHMQITTIGLDIANNVFAVHGIDAAEKVVVRKQLRRGPVLAFFKALPPCLVGMEACATAHYWAREFTKLGH